MNDSPLRIALLVKALPWHQAGGIEFHALDLARGLAKRGHHFTIITSSAPASPAIEIPPPAGGDAGSVSIEYAECGPPGRYSRAYYRETQRLLDELHAREPFDLIHAQEFASLYLRRPVNLPLALTVHGTLDSETPLAPPIFSQGSPLQKALWLWRFKHRWLLRGRYKKLLRDNDRIIVDSQFTAGELRRDGIDQGRISVVPLALDDARFKAPPPAEEARRRLGRSRPYVLTVSRLTWIKGLQLGIEALARANAGVDYVIAGDGPEKERLKRLAARHPGLTVDFIERVPLEQLPLYYAGATLALMPELSQPAFGLVALEANLAGVPVLAARTGALPEVLGEEGGWLFERGDVDQCADRLRELLANREALQLQGQKAAAQARERFSLKKMTDNTIAAYRQCQVDFRFSNDD